MSYNREFDPNVWTDKAFDNTTSGATQIELSGSVSAQGGVPLYYSDGFLPAGTGQTSGASGGGSLLSAITSGFETIIPAIFGSRSVAPVTAVTPPTLRAAGTGVVATATSGVPARVMGTITRTAAQHPVLTAAGGAAATAGAAALAARTLRGHKVNAAGQLVRRHRRMNPCNIRALRRGLRRAHAFERIARKVLHFTNPSKSHGVAHFKKARRKR